MSDYVIKVNNPTVPKLSFDQGNQLVEYVGQNYDQRAIGYVTPEGNFYHGHEKKSPLDVFPATGFYGLEAPKYVKQWFQNQNVSQVFLESLVIQGVYGSSGFAPHRDSDRTVALLYNVHGLADTVFYETKNSQDRSTSRFYNHNELVEIESHTFDLHQWYFLNTQKVHEIKNMRSNLRVAVALSWYDPVDDFQEFCTNAEQTLFGK